MLLLELSLLLETAHIKIKIINPLKKNGVTVRYLHDCHTKFESVIVLRAKLIERLGEQVPNTVTFDVGYYDGQHHSKIWLCSNKDLEVMYHKYPSGEITLWCDDCTNEDSTGCKKRER